MPPVAMVARLPLGAVLLLVGAVLGGRVLAHNELTSDDFFFFDAGRRLLEGHGLSLGIWGNARLHEDFLASYPPLGPLAASLNVWLVASTGSPYLVRSSAVLLALLGAVLLWRVLPPLGGWRSIVVLLAFVEPVAQTFYLNLRPEALILPLMLILYTSGRRAWMDPATARFRMLALASLVAVLTHWQFAVTIAFLAAALGLASLRSGSVELRRGYLGYLAVIAVGYGIYAGWILLSPERTEAFALQMLGPAEAGTVLQRLRFAGANLLVGDLAGKSGVSIYIVGALLYLAARARGDSEERRFVAFTLGFLLSSLIPAVYVAYLGPRAIPVYLVAVFVLVEAAARGTDRRLLIGCIVTAAAVNLAASTALSRGYFKQPWADALIGVPLLWAVGALALLVLQGHHRRQAEIAAVTVAIAASISWVQVARVPGPVSDSGMLVATHAALDDPMYDGSRVLCDIREHYLALWLLRRADRIYSTFPLLYFDTPADFERFTEDMAPGIVLLSEATLREMQRVPAGPMLADWLTAQFDLSDRFVVAGRTTEVYVRR
jgi:hypothetical protein